MADRTGVKTRKYFFGFAKFFTFALENDAPGISQGNRGSTSVKKEMNHATPVGINGEENFDKSCVAWATIFNLSNKTGQVHVNGWFNGQKVSENGQFLLPTEERTTELQAAWNKLMLISDSGKCVVISDFHDDWKTSVLSNPEQTKFVSCSVGELHSIVLDQNGKVFEIVEEKNAKKSYSYFSLRGISLKIVVDEVSCGKEHVLMLNKKHGNVFSFGLGSRGQLGLGQVDPETNPRLVEALAGISIKQVAAGGWHSLALSDIGDIYAWGWNDCGQLGITCPPPEVPQAFYVFPYVIEFPYECIVTHMACGARHSVAVTSEPKPSVWTWGCGQYGQLGHGDNLDRPIPTLVKYFENIKFKNLGITCGPWQTMVNIEKCLTEK